MKKILFLMLLFGVVSLSQISFAGEASVVQINSSTTNKLSSKGTSINQEETSTATIGFSSKSEKTVTTGRLPTTGESASIGISLFGLMLIIIIFRNELKEMIKNKKNRGDERE